jgi:hypothetical protein
MISGAVWAQQTAPPTPPPHNTKVAKKKASLKRIVPAATPAPVREVPAQTMPPIPATLMNSPPVKPNVTMEGGMLTIDAPNSTLSDVLGGVHKATGAAIEGASPSERVAVKLGPGDPEQVISALLRGTPYDYVILGSLGKPDAVTRVLLTQSGGESGQAGADSRRPQEEVQQQPSEDVQPEQTPDEVVTQPSADGQPDQAQPQPPPRPDQNQSKTPEQLFRELQQLQQQQQPTQPTK